MLIIRTHVFVDWQDALSLPLAIDEGGCQTIEVLFRAQLGEYFHCEHLWCCCAHKGQLGGVWVDIGGDDP